MEIELEAVSGKDESLLSGSTETDRRREDPTRARMCRRAIAVALPVGSLAVLVCLPRLIGEHNAVHYNRLLLTVIITR